MTSKTARCKAGAIRFMARTKLDCRCSICQAQILTICRYGQNSFIDKYGRLSLNEHQGQGARAYCSDESLNCNIMVVSCPTRSSSAEKYSIAM